MSVQQHPEASKKIMQLDAERDYEQIARLLSVVVFPWDIERSLEFALYRTYAVPSISELLVATGEFVENPCKRYDDTELLLAEIIENGFESASGQAALERINTMHGRYKISNDNFLYVLSTFVFEPIRWLEKFAWRPMTSHEQDAWFKYYQVLGEKMHIHNIPQSLQEFEKFNQAYEAQHFCYAASNSLVARKTRDLLLGFYLPKTLCKIARPVIYAIMDKRLLNAFKFPQASKLTQFFVMKILALRKLFLRIYPKNTQEKCLTARPRPTYPMGYAIKALGTFQKK